VLLCCLTALLPVLPVLPSLPACRRFHITNSSIHLYRAIPLHGTAPSSFLLLQLCSASKHSNSSGVSPLSRRFSPLLCFASFLCSHRLFENRHILVATVVLVACPPNCQTPSLHLFPFPLHLPFPLLLPLLLPLTATSHYYYHTPTNPFSSISFKLSRLLPCSFHFTFLPSHHSSIHHLCYPISSSETSLSPIQIFASSWTSPTSSPR